MARNIKPKLLLPVQEILHDLTLSTFLTPFLAPTVLSFGLQDSGTPTSFQLHGSGLFPLPGLLLPRIFALRYQLKHWLLGQVFLDQAI